MPSKTTIYAIYIPEEKELLDTLLHHLKTVKADQGITIWHDEPITSGQAWKPSDESRLHDTDIFLLLISNAFMYSEFIKQLEFKTIIDRYKAGESRVIPIILENCPWEIDFEADAYTFSFKELHVLPESGRPIKNWDSIDEAFQSCAAYIKSFISSVTEVAGQGLTEKDEEKMTATDAKEKQLALSFSEEMETKRRAEEELKIQKEALAQKRAVEEKSRIEEARLKQSAEAALRLQEVAEAKRRDKAALRLSEETKAKIKAKENWLLESVKAKPEAELMEASVPRNNTDTNTQEVPQVEDANTRKRFLLRVLVATLVIVGIILYARNRTKVIETLPPQLKKETIVNKESNKESIAIPKEKAKVSTPRATTSIVKLDIGALYKDGIIIEIDDTGQIGKIAHLKDAGPMPWQDAMKIEEQLGEGWRLPTLHELKLIYTTIGQGASNSGQLADEFYWSATPYDDNQARLLRFRDGNSSYHYNSNGTHRQFRVRAIRDFSR